MSVRRVLLASRSAGKLREARAILEQAGFAISDLREAGMGEDPAVEEALERFATFEENALAKARYFHTHSGMATVADDSGLEVVALGGAPGVFSKRWSRNSELPAAIDVDAANNAMLLRELQGVGDRSARYVCAAAWVSDGEEIVARGETAGEILRAPRGSGGFGYDPLFFSRELRATFAECTQDEKARVSHRGRALREIVKRVGSGR